MQWTRRGMMAGLLAGIATPLLADGPSLAPATSMFPRRRGDGGAAPSQTSSPDRLIAAAKLGGAVGFVVADATTGTVLEAHDPDSPLPPASVMKAMTAAYALDRLGLTHRFGTRILAIGPISSGIVQGDLVLAGGGDPVLDTDMLGDMAAQLAARGIKGVSGRYLLWDAALPRMERIDSEQPDYVGYNPAISGLNLNFNRVHFE